MDILLWFRFTLVPVKLGVKRLGEINGWCYFSPAIHVTEVAVIVLL